MHLFTSQHPYDILMNFLDFYKKNVANAPHSFTQGQQQAKLFTLFPLSFFFNSFSFLFWIVIAYIAAPILGTRPFAKKFYNYINSFTFSLRGM